MELRVTPKLLLIAALVVLSLAGIAGTFSHRDTIVPIVVGMDPSSPAPNQAVNLTVQMSGPASYDQDVVIGCTDPSAWTDLPDHVIIPAGSSSTTWTSHTSSVYTRWAVVTATANSGSALGISQ